MVFKIHLGILQERIHIVVPEIQLIGVSPPVDPGSHVVKVDNSDPNISRARDKPLVWYVVNLPDWYIAFVFGDRVDPTVTPLPCS